MRFIAACALLCALALPASVRARQDDVERLRIHGSNAMATRLVPAIVRAWLADSGYGAAREVRREGGVREIHAVRDGQPLVVEIAGAGSGAGLSALIDQRAELAMMARAPTAAERDAAWQLGDLESLDQAYTVAVDGVVAAVHAGNRVRALEVRQLRAVFAGRVRNWRELGGDDAPIRVLAPPRGSGAVEFFGERVMQRAALVAERLSQPRLVHALAADPHAIALLPARLPLGGARALAVADGGMAVTPDRAGLLSEDYPLTRRYTLHGAPMMSALGRSLATYAVGLRGQQAVERAGHLAVLLRPVRGAATPAGAADYRAFLGAARRMPLSLRFDPDHLESPFDVRAARDIERLVRLMQLPAMRGRALVLAAFASPDAGVGMIPTIVSNDRVDALAAILLARGVPVARARGFGASRALRGGAARHANERIEVWLL